MNFGFLNSDKKGSHNDILSEVSKLNAKCNGSGISHDERCYWKVGHDNLMYFIPTGIFLN